MKTINTFRLKRTSMAVLLALTPVTLQLAHAGAGWGESADALGGPIKTPTY